MIRRIYKHVPGQADSAANSARPVQAQITNIIWKQEEEEEEVGPVSLEEPPEDPHPEDPHGFLARTRVLGTLPLTWPGW